MTPEQELQDKLHTDPPKAGDNKQWLGNQLLFLSPKPSKVVQEPADWNGVFSEVNDTYLQIGGAVSRRAFQLQAINFCMFIAIFILYITPFIMCFIRYFVNPLPNTGLFESYWDWMVTSAHISVPCFLIMFLITYGTVAYTLFFIKRQSPLYFNRQRREVLFHPKHTQAPVIQPWESIVVWLAQQANFTGTAIIQHGSLGFILRDKNDPEQIGHVALQAPDSRLLLPQWAGIYNYMEQGPAHCPKATPAKPETLSMKRKRLHQEYKASERSLAYVIGWYLWHIFTLWSQPYWIAALEYKYLSRPTPTEAVKNWLVALPQAEWTNPSSEFLAYQSKVQQAIAQDKSFIDVANENKTTSDT